MPSDPDRDRAGRLHARRARGSALGGRCWTPSDDRARGRPVQHLARPASWRRSGKQDDQDDHSDDKSDDGDRASVHAPLPVVERDASRRRPSITATYPFWPVLVARVSPSPCEPRRRRGDDVLERRPLRQRVARAYRRATRTQRRLETIRRVFWAGARSACPMTVGAANGATRTWFTRFVSASHQRTRAGGRPVSADADVDPEQEQRPEHHGDDR